MQPKQGVGGHRGFQQGGLDTGGEPTAHQHAGANSSRTGYQNLYKRERGLFDSHSNRQHSSLKLFNKNGGRGTKSPELNMISKRIWQYRGRPTHLNVTADRESRNVKDSSEWKLNTNILHRLILRWGKPEMDLFASRTSPTSKICKPTSGSTMYESGCISNELGKANSLCSPPPPPPLLPYIENFKESIQGTSQGNDLDHTIMANPAMVSLSLNYVNKKPCFDTNER